MNELILSGTPEAPNPMKTDYKLPVFLLVIQVVLFAVEWGAMTDRIEAMMRHQEQQDRHMELIDSELTKRVSEAGEAKEFHDETLRRFDELSRKLDRIEHR